MTFTYAARLVCLCLEILFLANLVASFVVLGISKYVARSAANMEPSSAERWFFTLRVTPFVLSVFAVLALCIPSYLRFEENAGTERVGLACLTLALLGLGLCIALACRSIRALARSYSVKRSCNRLQRIPSTTALTEDSIYLATEESTGLPLLALVGIFRPRLIVSQRLLDALSAQQVEVAFSHESAHRSSRDNLKRLFFVLTPDVFPFLRAFRGIEMLWQHYAELAADDKATGGRSERATALAETLIHVARLGNSQYSPSLISSLSTQDVELSIRINRLLAIQAPALEESKGGRSKQIYFLAFGTLLLLLVMPNALSALYPLLEALLR